jgi:ferredoxin-thioredoxin reductase catalytic chain
MSDDNPLEQDLIETSRTAEVDQVSDEDRGRATPKNVDKMWKYARHYAEKSGSYLHPQEDITEFLVIGLAKHIDEVGKPLCPCNFYDDKVGEAKKSTWICACDEMQRYKYCHCLLFVTEDGLPITEYLPPDHEGREIYGVIKDPHPDKGRALGRLEEQRGTTLEKSTGKPPDSDG